MTNKCMITMAALLVASLSPAQAQTTITAWDFDAGGTIAAPYNNPTPSFGTGTATVLGMNNTYNGTTSTANADVLASAGASTGSGSYGWRVRGTPGNGWSTNAPVGTQGAEFAVSTAGYTAVNVSFDIDTTAQAEANVELEYTIDGSTWLTATLSSAGTDGTLENSGLYDKMGPTAGWDNGITASIPGAQGDPNFAIEVVNASTGAADLGVSGSIYNNSSGNWRFDNVDISGTAVPEPTTLALAGLGLTGLMARRQLRHS